MNTFKVGLVIGGAGDDVKFPRIQVHYGHSIKQVRMPTRGACGMVSTVNRSAKTCNFAECQVMDTFKGDSITTTEKREVRYVLIPRRT